MKTVRVRIRSRYRTPHKIGVAVVVAILLAAALYSRHIDWPSLGGETAVRGFLPDTYPVSEAHHYTYTNFMDTWELYRFTTNPEGIEYLSASLNLGPPSVVHAFPLIVTPPPPYWWHPEVLPDANLFSTHGRAPDGHIYQVLFAPETGITYMIKFDG